MQTNIANMLTSNKNRWILFQVIALGLLLVFFYQISGNALENITSRGIKVGFGFLWTEAGFYISETLIDYDASSTYWDAFLVGVTNTLYVSFFAILFSSIIGLIIGIARFSNNWLIRKIASAYVETFRNIPILLQIIFWHNIIINTFPSVKQSFVFFDSVFINSRGIHIPKATDTSDIFLVIFTVVLSIVLLVSLSKKKASISKGIYNLLKLAVVLLPFAVYFALGGLSFEAPKLTGFNFEGGSNISPEFFALVFALSVYTATYIAEAVRSGIESVNIGQKEAAKALGLSHKQTIKFVVLPQALRVAIPPIINQYLNVSKNSSLAVAIGYPDLVSVFTGTTLNQVGQALEIVSITMLVYLLLSLFISFLLNIVNDKLKIQER